MGDFRTTTGEPLPDSRRERKRRVKAWARWSLIGLAVVIVLGWIIRVPRHVLARGYVTTTEYAEVRPASGGQVAEILVHSNDRVNQGDTLVRLDDAIEQASLDEAKGLVARLEADLVRRESELAESTRRRRHELAQAQLRLEHTHTTLALLEALHEKGLASGRALADKKVQLTLAQAELDARRAEDLTLPEKELDVMRRELESKRSAMERAAARVAAREERAPNDGVAVR